MWDAESFVAELRAVGTLRYHDQHPFHRRMNAGLLSPDQIRLWIANRFYYQQNIPVKDALIVAACPLPAVRRAWLQRIVDHDGRADGEGGLEAWLRLAEAAGLDRSELWDQRHLLPGVRFAVDAYVQLVRSQPWPVAVASSLTELFAPDLMRKRLAAFEQSYGWIDAAGLSYFRQRLTQARDDAQQALRLTIDHCNSSGLQLAAVAAVQTKCDILWSLLDAIDRACEAPRPDHESGARLAPVASPGA